MSQITERTNIMSIDESPSVQEVYPSMVTLGELDSYQPLRFSVSDMKGFCPENIFSALNASGGSLSFVSSNTKVCSPNSLRASFGASFSPTIKKMEMQGLTSLDAKKASFISTLSKMDFKVTDRRVVSRAVQTIMSSKDETVANSEIKAIMKNLEGSQTKAFTLNLAKACAVASTKVGFSQVSFKPVNGKLEVTAKNQAGKHIVSEISVDEKTNQVNCHTETIGIYDGSCKQIMNQFNEEMKKMGIKIGDEKTTYTGGACQLPYSKMLDQNDKDQQRKKKEQERMKKLNSSLKTRI